MPVEKAAIEFRAAGKIELRAASDGKPAQLVGYAAVFNELSVDLGGFREIIMPGAFDRVIEEEQDVRALIDHNSGRVLGRTKSGTLRLDIDKRGLHVEIDVPDTQDGRDTLTLVERGDLSQMSFAFWTITDNWRKQDGEVIRELIDVDVDDVAVVAYPAYPQTEVSARALARARELKAAPPPWTPPVEDLRLRTRER